TVGLLSRLETRRTSRAVVIGHGGLERGAIPDPLRWGRSPVAGQGVDASGILRAQPLERPPGPGFRGQGPSRPLRAGARIPNFLDLDAGLVLVREAEIQHQVLDTVAADCPRQLRPA